MLHDPAVAEDGDDAEVEHRPDDLDAGGFDGEVPHVVASFEVDFDAGGFGGAAVVEVHEGAAEEGGEGAADAEGDEAHLFVMLVWKWRIVRSGLRVWILQSEKPSRFLLQFGLWR